MELGETLADGAARETREEACAEVDIGHLFASVDVVDAGQVHQFFTARLTGGFAAGEETLEVALFPVEDIPWDEIAFRSGVFALRKYIEDGGRNNGVHLHEVRRSHLRDNE
jgi:ADP-ribose pyrophosphatase YjhB (NUDIX family)